MQVHGTAADAAVAAVAGLRASGLPVLGICRGMQLINVAAGGRMSLNELYDYVFDRVRGDAGEAEAVHREGLALPDHPLAGQRGAKASFQLVGSLPETAMEALLREKGCQDNAGLWGAQDVEFPSGRIGRQEIE